MRNQPALYLTPSLIVSQYTRSYDMWFFRILSQKFTDIWIEFVKFMQ